MDNINHNDIMQQIFTTLQEPPEEVSVNVIIKGVAAKKFHLIQTILKASYPELEDEEIDKFIIRSGVEREMSRLSNIFQDE
jgi:hypothetical protein